MHCAAVIPGPGLRNAAWSQVKYDDEGNFVVVKHAAIVTAQLLANVLQVPAQGLQHLVLAVMHRFFK